MDTREVEADAMAAPEEVGKEEFVLAEPMALELMALHRAWPSCQVAPEDGTSMLDPAMVVQLTDRLTS